MAEEDLVARLRATGVRPFTRDMRTAARSVASVGDEADDVTVSAKGLARQLARTSATAGGFGSSIADATAVTVASRLALGGMALAAGGLAAILALPLVASLGAAAAGMAALGAAAYGVAAPAMLLAAGVAARYKDTAHIAGSGAHNLAAALDRLKTAANRAISPAAARMMDALADGARRVAPVVAGLREPFLQFARSAGRAVRIVASGVAELGPELRATIRGAGGVLEALAPAVAPFAGMLLDITRGALPHLLQLTRDVARTVSGWRAYTADVGALRDTIGGLVGHLRSWVHLGAGVTKIMVGIGRALAPTGKGWVDTLGDGANRLGDFLNSAKGIAAVRGVFQGLLGGIAKVGQFLGFLGGVAIKAGRQLLDALAPARPFVDNVLAPLFLGFAKGVLGSVVAAFKVVVPVIGLFARGLGWLGTQARPLRGVFQGVGQVLGFIFAGPVLKLLGAVPKLGVVFRVAAVPIRLLGRAVGVVAGFLGRVFAPALQRVGSLFRSVTGVVTSGVRLWLGAHRMAFRALVGVWRTLGGLLLGAAKGAMTRVWGFFKGLGGTAVNVGKGVVRGIARGIASGPQVLLDALKTAIGKAVDQLPGPIKEAVGALGGVFGAFAEGGTARKSGRYVVGERGPEVVNLHRGDRVTPNAALGAAPRLERGVALFQLEVVSKLDGREVGRGMTRVVADDLTGRG